MNTSTLLAEMGYRLDATTAGDLYRVPIGDKFDSDLLRPHLDQAFAEPGPDDNFKCEIMSWADDAFIVMVPTKGNLAVDTAAILDARLARAIKMYVHAKGQGPFHDVPDSQDVAELAAEEQAGEQYCSECGEPQTMTFHGAVCKNGHGGVEPIPQANTPASTRYRASIRRAHYAAKNDPAPDLEAPPAPVGSCRTADLVAGDTLEAGETIVPSSDQERALAGILNAQGHCILSGDAGTGKSTVVDMLAAKRRITICATTARAALNVGGVTIDRIFCFNRSTWQVNYGALAKSMRDCQDLIVVDEASMMGDKMSKVVEECANSYGKRLLLVGDWAQASPVKEEWATSTSLFLNAQFFKLTTCHRQSDPVYLGALNKVRRGVVDDEVRQAFQRCIVTGPPADDRFIRLYATNRATDDYNAQRLIAIPDKSPIITLEAKFADLRDSLIARASPFQDDWRERQMQESKVAHGERFRVNARVLLTVNDPEGEFVNGDAGIITDIILSDGRSTKGMTDNPWEPVTSQEISTIVVKLDRFDTEFSIERIQQAVAGPSGRPQFSITGFPIRLGWAITCHRAQGLTVDRAYFDMSSVLYMKGESKHGLSYVAMSRTRTLDGLMIGGWCDDAVFCAEAVKSFI